LEDNQDKPIDEIKAAAAAKEEDDDEDDTEAKIKEIETGKAASLVCNECGKKFRNHDLATYHATKTYVELAHVRDNLTDKAYSEHTDFSESTEEIAPLTEDEKKAKLEELRERLQAKRALQSVKDKEDQKRNEVSRLRQSRLEPNLMCYSKSVKSPPRRVRKPRKNWSASRPSRKLQQSDRRS
jgi:hypothetical protein